MLLNLRANKLSFLLIITSLFFFENPIYSEKLLKNNFNNEISTTKSLIANNDLDYLLGPGDTLYLNFSGISIFSKVYKVDNNGYIYLPEIKRVFASNKTIDELSKIIIDAYKEFIFDPNISIRINSYRPTNVYVKGEVNKPGLYTLSYIPTVNGSDTVLNGNEPVSFSKVNSTLKDSITTYKAPRLFDALQLTKGITNFADLSNIKVIRKNSITNGGGKLITTLNLLSLLKEGNQNVNIKIRDGDTIVVGRSDKIIKDQIIEINKSNLTPDSFTVYISGNIASPGSYQLKHGSTLNQAIYQAGGEQNFSGNVIHMRLNEYGKTEKNFYTLDTKSKSNLKNSPVLFEGDIIHINTTLFGKTTRLVENISRPILTTFTIFKIFE